MNPLRARLLGSIGSRGRALVGGVVASLCLLEAVLPLFDARYAHFFRRGLDGRAVHLNDARKFLSSGRFDRALGWVDHPPACNWAPSKNVIAVAYGDSFVHSGGDENSWESQFEAMTGKTILNLGQGGYGLDQAVLKFEMHRSSYTAPIALLGLYREAYRRTRNHHSYYYFANKERWKYAFKPIFVEDGKSFRLIEPPCSDAACLLDAVSGGNPQVNATLRRFDFFYQANRSRPPLAFPRVRAYARVIPSIVEKLEERRGRRGTAFVDAFSQDLARYLVKRFAGTARSLGMTPVCLLLYDARELSLIKKGKRLDRPMIEFLEREKIQHIDTVPGFLKALPSSKDFHEITLKDGHMNPQGNHIIAKTLSEQLLILGRPTSPAEKKRQRAP